jgi:hypothetical protein
MRRYTRGNSFSLAITGLGCTLAAAFTWYLARMNAEKLAGSDEASAKRHMTIEDIEDEHPDFLYYL